MTINQVMRQQLDQITGQIMEYNANINNLLGILTNLQEQQQAITAWLAANPGSLL